MNGSQYLSLAVLGGMMLLFIWGRLRYDLVAILALLAAVLLGVVPVKRAFSGFSDDIVIIVGSALVVSGAVARSGVVERLIGRVARYVRHTRSQLLLLVTSVTLLSGLVKNIGALAMLMPAAFQLSKRSNSSPSTFLMPMSFGSLLGGLVTLVGTSPNIIVSRVREDMIGKPFGMFDYAPVGLGLAAVGIVFLGLFHRLLPDRRAPASMAEALNISDYITEARVSETSSSIGMTLAEFRSANQNEVTVTSVVRAGAKPKMPMPDYRIDAGDLMLMQGEPEALERAIASGELQLEGLDREHVADGRTSEVGVLEAVVTRESRLSGQTPGRLRLHAQHGINLLAVSRAGKRFTERLRDIAIQPGDVVVLQGPLEILPERLRELGCLPLAHREIRLGGVRGALVPILILGAAMALTALGIVPVAMAFFGAAALIMITGVLPAREAYEHIEWPILIMLGALIPVSDSLRTTGATEVLGSWLSHAAVSLPPWGAVALILAAAMAVTPFLNNAATVLVMAPIGVTFANDLGYRPEAFLMAVAVGAGSDFLTPIGHQCNTLVMGPGGYRFGDYARLGAPLSLLVILAGVPLIMAAWPLH